MSTKYLISRGFSVLLIVTFLLTGTLPVRAESPASQLYASGDFLWAKNLGDQGDSFALDSNGNIYIAGGFRGTADLDPGPGTFYLTSIVGSIDIVLSKFNSSGDFLWAKQIGGTESDYANSIAIDSNNNVYATGQFNGNTDFDPNAGVYSLTSAGYSDIFVSKLDSNGNFIWAKSMGGASNDYGLEIAVDSSGNIYTMGNFLNIADFDPGIGIANLTGVGGSYNIFVCKLDSSGNFAWAKGIGGTIGAGRRGIVVDTSGSAYITGSFQGAIDFDPGAGVFNLTSVGIADIFISKLDSNGNFIWAKQMGGINENKGYIDAGHGIALDTNGNIYTTGSFNSTGDFDPGADTFNLTSAGDDDIFVSKLDNNGNFVWAKSMGGINIYIGRDVGYEVAIDSSNNIYTTGMFSSNIADFDPGVGTYNLANAGEPDIFISKLDSNGNFIWAKGMGGPGYDAGSAIAVDSIGDVYTTGSFSGTVDFDPGIGTFNLTSEGSNDIFISTLQGGNVAPIVLSVVRANVSPTSSATVEFTVTFSESVTGVDASDFTLTKTDVSAGVAVSGVSGSGSSYSVTVYTGMGNGTIRLNVVNDGSIKDATLNQLGADFNNGETYTVIKSATFMDVPLTYWASSYIERLYNAGITSGCEIGTYCPDSTVTRAQMAVFLLKGIHGSSYSPPAVGTSAGFTDVSINYWAAAWIKQLAAEGITSGCGGGNYCPDSPVTRAQMAIFLLKAKHGSVYLPPVAAGVFTDVPIGYWADKWIEQLAFEGITAGCGTGIYCPDNSVTRAQMAVFLVKTFNLP